MNFDYFLFQKINNLAGQLAWVDKIGIFLAEYLPYLLGLLAAVFIIYWFWRNKNWKLLWQTLAVLILSRLIITEVIRFFYYRPRPFLVHPVHQLLNHDITGSFPSGHMTFLFALSTIVYFYHRKLGWLFFVASFLVGLARVFVGVHYPLDVLAGAVIGIFSGWLISKILK